MFLGSEVRREVGAEDRHAQGGLEDKAEIVDGLQAEEVGLVREASQARQLAMGDVLCAEEIFAQRRLDRLAQGPISVLAEEIVEAIDVVVPGQRPASHLSPATADGCAPRRATHRDASRGRRDRGSAAA